MSGKIDKEVIDLQADAIKGFCEQIRSLKADRKEIVQIFNKREDEFRDHIKMQDNTISVLNGQIDLLRQEIVKRDKHIIELEKCLPS